MRRLVLIRHGKADWDKGLYEDFKRPLKSRGKMDGEIIAENVLKKEPAPDAFFASKAARASETALIIKNHLKLSENILHFDLNLYTFEWHDLLTYVRSMDDSLKTVWIAGHNPALTELVNFLSFEKKLLNLQTTGVAVLELDISSWEEARKDCGELAAYHYPKEFKSHTND
jgi:phosphohistidine phosphatase